MAIYHYHREIGKRHKGKNAVFAVAYIRGEKRTCHKTQETKDFTYKHDVIYSECLLPDDAPAWALKIRNSHIKDENGHYVFDKNGFNFSDYAWNQIEIVEKRYDSQLYFHDDFAIPVELNQEAAIQLVRDFAKEKLAVDGLFCDVAIHWELINPHAHVVMPLRQLTEEGFSKKRRFGKGDLSKIVTQIRSDWADYANRKMREQGIDARIDHRSHKARGLELTPTVKVGKATYMTDTKQQEIRVAENQLIRAQNFAKIKANPDILATKIAQEHHEFTHAQIEDEVGKYVVGEHVLSQIEQREDASRERLVNDIIEILHQEKAVFSERELKALVMEKTDSLDDFNGVAKQIGQSDTLFNLGLGDDGRTHYVTRQAFNLETELSGMAEHLSAKNSFLVSDVVVERVAKEFGLNKCQRIALKHLTQSGNLALVVGVAGSGKTYMLKAAKAVWEESGYRVRGVAFSGRASAGMESEADIRSQTIAGFMQSIREGYSQFGSNDILVMDEMGMTSLDDMHQIVRVVTAGGGKLAGTGDTEQTQPVGRGAPMRAMIEQVGCVVMDTIIRQKIDWQATATLAMETQQTAKGLDAYHEHGQVHFAETAIAAQMTLVDHWYRQFQQHEQQLLREHILIAYKNETVDELNQLARAKLVAGGILAQGTLVDTGNGRLAIAKGERVLFGRNDYRLHVKNGDFGTVVNVDGHTLTVKLDNEREITFSTTQYGDFNYGYAATVHKMQGFTGDYAFEYIDSRGYDRHLFLVGSSRHRYNLTIMADHERFKDYDDLKHVVSRHGLKDHIFDYPVSFSIRRGFEPNGVAKRTVNFVRRATSKAQDSWLWLMNYQAYIEKQKEKSRDPHEAIKQQRQDAIIVADFCDRRIEIAQGVEALKAMPGYELKLNYLVVPDSDNVEHKVMTLYTDKEALMFAALDEQDKVTRMLLDTSQLSDELTARIDKVLNDVEGTARLGEKETEAIFDVTSKLGFIPIDKEEKVERQRTLYKQQLKNSELARIIQSNYDKFKLAMDRNRINRVAIEKSVAFGDRHDEIKALAERYRLKQFYDPIIADKIVAEMPMYYGHIVSAFGDNKTKNRFIAELKHQMHQRRYDTAFETFGVEYRSEIKAVKHYLDLDYEVGGLLVDQDNKTDAIKERLQSISNKRNEIAGKIAENYARFERIIEHFMADQKRIRKHQQYHQARETVKLFSALSDSIIDKDNLHKQALARKIKMAPKRHGIYVNDYLKEGWKSINLENWHYERKLQLSKASLEFKASHRIVRRYFDAAYAARDAWQAAIKRRNAHSPNTKAFTLCAQGLSNQRDKIASLLINDMEVHAGAIGFEKVDLAKLSTRARHYDYFQRYLKETNETRKMHMAHHISENMKGFGHAVNLSGLYQDIKECARHYDYLHLVKSAPNQAVRDVIRLAEHYQQKRIDAGRAWGQVKAAERLGKDTARLLVEAKHITVQRNRIAYEFVQETARQGMLDPQIRGIKLDFDRLNKSSQQYIAYQDVMNYLSATDKDRGKLANELLKNRASYHFIFDKKIDFNDLRTEANVWLNSQEMVAAPSTKTVETKRWDFELISQALMSNPEDTYTALLGEPKKRTSKEWRYEGGLIVTLKGNAAGKWYSFTESKGGGPIKAIQEWMGLSFKDALKYGAALAGLTEAQAVTTEALQMIQERAKTRSKERSDIAAIQRARHIESAKSIWDGTESISGTLAERYFHEHRNVSTLDRMEIRHWPIGAEWVNYDAHGKRKVQPNKVPAAVIALKDARGELTGVQRIYLDKNTANKATFMDNAKLSKGVIQGSAGIIQKGAKGGRVYIAEGPETGASLAMVDRDATVLVSMGINNLPNLVPVISSLAPRELILAADNDGDHSKTRKTTEKAFATLQSNLNTASISCRLVYPLEIVGMKKVDWNDVLVKQGAENLKSQLNLMDKTIGINDLYYDTAKSIAYTPAEHYLREVKGLMGVDLSDVRYHPGVSLPGGQAYQQAMILPILNQKGQRKAELIMLLSKDAKNIEQTIIRGESQGCATILQRGNDTSTVFIADNIIDAKSIAVGNPDANVFVSLRHYRDLGDITWVMDTLPKKPGSIALVTDNFDTQNEKALFELSQSLRNQKYHVVMVKGKLKGDYTHVSINESLLHQDKVHGTNYIQRMAIKSPIPEKQSLKEKLSRAIKGKKIAEEKTGFIKRPTPIKEQSYYMKLTKTQRQKLNAYFASCDQLSKQDRYKDALDVAKTASAVYGALKEEVRQVNFHPQRINRIQMASEFKLIRERIRKRQPLGLIDTAALLKEISIPKMDTKTQKQFSELAKKLSEQNCGKDYETSAEKFMKDKATLVKAWRKNEAMPGSGHSFSSHDAKRIVTDTIDRDTFLGMTKALDETIRTHNKNYGKKQGRKPDDGRSRGGRSR